MKSKKNIGLLDGKRFDYLNKKRITNLRSLTPKKSIRIMESLLDSGLNHEFQKLKKYLESWAQKISDEAEDFRVYNEIKRLL